MGTLPSRHQASATPPSRPGSAIARRLGTFLLLGVLGLIAALAWWWTHPPEPSRELQAHHHPLRALERVPVHGRGRGLERWSMVAAGSDTVSGLWRAGARSHPEWVVVLLGGIGTDDRAALLVPESLPVGVLAVSWPWKGPRRMHRHEFLARVPEFHHALLATPGAIARGVEAVRRVHPGARVALVGASLGVPPTAAALALVRPDALVIVDGAADLERLLRSEVADELGRGAVARVFAPAAASLGSRLLSSLEPSHFGPLASALPVLLVDAEAEERYPPECVARLHTAFPHATRARHPGGHIRPEDRSQVVAVIDAAASWMGRLASGPGVSKADSTRRHSR